MLVLLLHHRQEKVHQKNLIKKIYSFSALYANLLLFSLILNTELKADNLIKSNFVALSLGSSKSFFGLIILNLSFYVHL